MKKKHLYFLRKLSKEALRSFLSRAYDMLYEKAIALTQTNYCQFSCNGCLKGNDGPSWCCKGCKYIGPKGCTIEALTCRAWACPTAELSLFVSRDKRLRKLRILNKYIHLFGFYGYRFTKEESLNQAMIKFSKQVRKVSIFS